MKPIRAQFNYTVEVPVDRENPAHREFFDTDFAIEKRVADGFVTDVIILNDANTSRLLDGVQDGKSVYRDAIIEQSGVYVVFWEDLGDRYRMRVENYSQITVSSKEMHNYVSKHYSA